MTQEQWNFIFKFYPEYGQAPYDMMIYLYGQAKFHEELYNKPSSGGIGMEGEEDTLDDKYDRGIGHNKQTNKKDSKQAQDAAREA